MVFIKFIRILHVILIFLLAISFLGAHKINDKKKNDLDKHIEKIKNNKLEVSKAKQNNHNHIMCVTIPKCGTHLFLKCLTLFNLKNISFEYNQEFKLDKRMKDAIAINKKLAPSYYRG